MTLRGRGFTYPWRFDQTELRATLDGTIRHARFDRALVWAGAEALWFGRSDLPRAVVDVIDCNPLEFWRGFLSYRDLRQRYWALREIGVATRFARRMVRGFAATVCVGAGGCPLAAPDRRRRYGARDTERCGCSGACRL